MLVIKVDVFDLALLKGIAKLLSHGFVFGAGNVN